MMLDEYTQTKNLLVSYDPKPLGFLERLAGQPEPPIECDRRLNPCPRPIAA